MSFLKRIVILSIVSCLVFSAIGIILTCFGVILPDTLIDGFYDVFGKELGALALLQIAKYIIKDLIIDNKLRRKKENGVPLESSDFEAESGSTYGYEDYYDGGEISG